jgi:hypothetical protein
METPKEVSPGTKSGATAKNTTTTSHHQEAGGWCEL